uniref:Secreted protein n=1 Tax=Globodera pallida TaxID=36090 RepID=A0A183BZU0_GLOPA
MDSKSGLATFALLTALTLPGLSWGDDSTSSPEEFTPCEKMMAKCTDNWGECFPRDGYKGDACCEKGASWKCSEKMNTDEMMSKDPTYAKMINCFLVGHPDLESLKKCMPHPSECKSPRSCWINWKDFEVCPKLLKCVQRKHSNWDALKKCLPKDYYEKECNDPLPPIDAVNAPLPPIENATEA